MTTATITLYEMLVDAGVDKDRARDISEKFVTQEDARHFATKSDIADLRTDLANVKSTLVMWMFGMNLTNIALVVGLIELLK